LQSAAILLRVIAGAIRHQRELRIRSSGKNPRRPIGAASGRISRAGSCRMRQPGFFGSVPKEPTKKKIGDTREKSETIHSPHAICIRGRSAFCDCLILSSDFPRFSEKCADDKKIPRFWQEFFILNASLNHNSAGTQNTVFVIFQHQNPPAPDALPEPEEPLETKEKHDIQRCVFCTCRIAIRLSKSHASLSDVNNCRTAIYIA
jgi:hypothetical protein